MMWIFFILCLRHIVRKDETLSSIGKIYSVDWSLICSANKLKNCNVLSVGQVLEIPDSGITSNYITYKVVSGDTLGKIANKYSVDVDKLAQINHIANKNVINVGQTLQIPSNKGAVIVPSTSTISNQKTYKVKSGDKLSIIASRFSTTVKTLQQLNGIANANKIQVGQVLKLPNSANNVVQNPKVTNSKQKAPVNKNKRNDLPSTTAIQYSGNDRIEITLNKVFRHEGRCQNGARDPGNKMNGKIGYTCAGVTPSVGYRLRNLYYKYAVDKCSRVASHMFVKCAFDLSNDKFIEGTKQMYIHEYFIAGGCNDFPQPLHYVCSDIAVNSGPGRSKAFIRELGKYNGNAKSYARRMNEKHRQFYIKINNPKYIKGWLNRAAARDRFIDQF